MPSTKKHSKLKNKLVKFKGYKLEVDGNIINLYNKRGFHIKKYIDVALKEVKEELNKFIKKWKYYEAE